MLTFNNITPSSFAADTQQGAGRRRPRHREALSCSQCRERKVRCDRRLPCKQCQGRGYSNSCSYGSSKDASANSNANAANGHATNHNHGNNNVNHSNNNGNNENQASNQQRRPKAQTEPSSPLSSVSGDSELRRRLDRLEQMMNTNTTINGNSAPRHTYGQQLPSGFPPEAKHCEYPSSSSSTVSLPQKSTIQCPQGLILSAKTRYIGGTHWLAACNNMTVLNDMLNKSPEFARSYRAFAEVKALTKQINATTIPFSISILDATHLFKLLPPRQTCDDWITAYHQTYRHIYDIVDELTLESTMEKVWNGRGCNDDPTVICIVLLLVCVGMQSDEKARLEGRRLARHVEQYAFASGILQKPCIGSMKVLLLLTLLKTIACSDTESLDSLSAIMGLTTQVALAMGLHRNPNAFGNITSYRAEIRKRLWSVYFRLNFEHCMRIGVPLALQPEDTDVGYPTNVNLPDLASDAESEVEGKELPMQTDATFSIIAARLAGVAAQYQRAICSAGNTLPLDATKQLRDSYHNLLTEAPMYMRSGTKTANAVEEIQQAFLAIAMHSTLLTLALHFANSCSPDAVQEQQLNMVVEHSLTILHSFQLLTQRSRHVETLAYQLLWSETCRAAFSAGMALNRLRILRSKSFMATRHQHALLSSEALIKYLTVMSRFWLRNAHLGPIAAKNCLLLSVIVSVTSRLFSDETDVSEKELLEVGALSAEQMVEQMKVALRRRHPLPLSPEPSIPSASLPTRMLGDSGRSISSPNITDSWSTTTSMVAHPPPQNSTVMDTFGPSQISVYGTSFITPEASVGWTPQEMWPMEFDYPANSASMSPISHVPSRQTTAPAFVDGLISPAGTDWHSANQWGEEVSMHYV